MGPTQEQTAVALKRLGHYRVVAAQRIGFEGPPDGISGALTLAVGLRETWGKNINNPAQTDHGCFQISELYHSHWLRQQPGCPEGKWRATSAHTAYENGYCPRFTPACLYATDLLKNGRAFGISLGLSPAQAVRFGIAAYNAGIGGARNGLKDGDVDKYTTGGDYSAWVIAGRTQVNRWLGQHPNWKVTK